MWLSQKFFFNQSYHSFIKQKIILFFFISFFLYSHLTEVCGTQNMFSFFLHLFLVYLPLSQEIILNEEDLHVCIFYSKNKQKKRTVSKTKYNKVFP